MQVRNKQRPKTKGDGFYHPKEESKPHEHKRTGEHSRKKRADDDDEKDGEDMIESEDLAQMDLHKGKEVQALVKTQSKQQAPKASVRKARPGGDGAKGGERRAHSTRERKASGSIDEDDAAQDSGEAGGAAEMVHPKTESKREVTLAMTRSGAINELSSRFLRDSDEAVQARKVHSTRPFEKKDIVPRIYAHLPFPVRQDWSQVKSAEELDKLETAYFEEWLDQTYKGRNINHVSPFEHNLEVWRQLWRVLEKSHIIVLTADIRDPLLHIPVALHKHVTGTHKLPMLIVLTKCDLVSEEHVAKWKRFLSGAFDPESTKVISNSGKCQSTHGIGGYAARRKILHARATHAQIAEMHRQSHQVLETAINFAKSKRPDLEQVSIGIIGQPNTGKSSLVNAILGRHAVSVSRTCGHTKHWQTQLIKNDQGELIATLIDSPGLIFPMAVEEASQQDSVSPRAWFECSGLYPIAQIREPYSAVRFAGERIDLPRMYNLKLNVDDYGDEWSPYAFLGSLADKRGYTLQMGGGAPDMHRAGLETIYDICDGIILMCFPPPELEDWRLKTKEESAFQGAKRGSSTM